MIGNFYDEMPLAKATHSTHVPPPYGEYEMPPWPPSKKTSAPQVLCLADALTGPEASPAAQATPGKTGLRLPLADMLPPGPSLQATNPGPSPSGSSVRLNLELLTLGAEEKVSHHESRAAMSNLTDKVAANYTDYSSTDAAQNDRRIEFIRLRL